MLRTRLAIFALVVMGIILAIFKLPTPLNAVPLDPIQFGRDVRPILSDRCFGCHGPDANKRKAGLRLDTAEGAYAALKSGHRAIVPGDLAASELAKRISSVDPDEVMPPPKLNRPLTESECGILRRWIDDGAEYRKHWAFVAPERAAEPALHDRSWVRDPLDAFVLKKIEDAQLAPEPEADRVMLLRRASLVLTGLPPTLEEIDAFSADQNPGAYERRVDALLTSPRAAEHRATAWLDLARFADTFGYQSDSDSFTWPWRDWLLKALESNMPYDQFATAMIAGDLLPITANDDEISNKVASAFNRLHRMTEEGGSICEELRQEGIADRVSTFSTVFLGLTVECARCHDHKYDPIPTSDFYGLAAMFGLIDENGLKPFAIPSTAPPPFVRLATKEQAARTAQLRAAVDANAVELARAAAEPRIVANTQIMPPAPAAMYSFDTLADGKTPNSIDASQPATTDRTRPEQLGQVAIGEGKVASAMHFDGDGGLSLVGLQGFTRFDPVSFAFWIKPGERNERATILQSNGFYTNDADGSGIELLIDKGRLRWSIIHLWPGSAASIEMRDELPLNIWTHIVATYDGLSRAGGLKLYIDGRQTACDIVRDALDGPINASVLELGSRSRDAGFRSGAIDEFAAWRQSLTAHEAGIIGGAINDSTTGSTTGSTLDNTTLAAHLADRATHEQREKLRDAQRELGAHLDSISAFMCMADSPYARPTFVLTRGAYDQPDQSKPAKPGAISAVFPVDFAQHPNRLGLAAWLVNSSNPLAARVEVNRLWAQVFGRGLVETSENFGLQGAWPLNAEVLDLLATDFVRGEHAWDMNHMLRRLVLSATFRQSSVTSQAKRARDPNNDLLSRGPSVRLTAEMLRDCSLFSSGLLVEKFCGPSVKPYQQPNLVGDSGAHGGYISDTGDPAHRRSLYTFRKRTVPPPTMLTFDSGSREACQSRRFVTNTPLQALAIMNDPIFTECANALAQRAIRETSGDLDSRIVRAFELIASRAPRTNEIVALRTLITNQIASGEQDEISALALACTTMLLSDAAIMSR